MEETSSQQPQISSRPLSVSQTLYMVQQASVTTSQVKNGETHLLDLRYVGPKDMITLRVMIYVPKKPGTSFVPPQRKGVFQPDKNAFWVLYDKSHDLSVNTETHKHAHVNLRKMISEYASSGSTLEKGDIKITFITAGSTSNVSYNYQLGFSNV